ncbi:MAG: M28 family metallopeptidase [Bacteroidetes bacterium]|nr:M28 family metallopeptidase [Bacteroidota bacterium]
MLLPLIFGCSDNQIKEIILPPDFTGNIFRHITELTKIGPRYVGSNFEKQAAVYIENQLNQIGLETTKENFQFETFEIQQSQLFVGSDTIIPSRICFNPYKDSLTVSDRFVLIDSLSDNDISNKFVVASEKINYFQIVFRNPKMIIYVDSRDLEKLKNVEDRNFKLKIKGKIEKYHSANVVADLKSTNENAKEIILCAHYDSFHGSPGADDNASGISALIELSRILFNNSRKLDDFNIKFVAFSGEEKGLLGSRHFLDAHSNDFKNCELVINMDQIGGKEPINIVVLDSIKGIPASKGKTQFPEYLQDKPFDGVSSKWTIIAPEIFSLMQISNTPDWLVEVIKKSSTGMTVNQVSGSGSDEMVFTQAGIVSTCIFTGGNQTHSSKDVPEQVNLSTIEQVGKLTLNIIINTIVELTKPNKRE